jgi:hypothetical protein
MQYKTQQWQLRNKMLKWRVRKLCNATAALTVKPTGRTEDRQYASVMVAVVAWLH